MLSRSSGCSADANDSAEASDPVTATTAATATVAVPIVARRDGCQCRQSATALQAMAPAITTAMPQIDSVR